MTEALLCDAMLGTLSKMLRIMGFDTAYATSDLHDDEVLAWAVREKRVLLTRDFPLSRRADAQGVEVVLLRDLPVEQQVTIMLTHRGLPLEIQRFFSRCILDNGVLEPRTVDEVKDEVPAAVAGKHTRFTQCPECARVYWPGTHVADMDQRLRDLVEGLGT